MLARRFTIVCLLTTLFGMFFAVLVIEASRRDRPWEVGMLVPCDAEPGFKCTPPAR